LGQITYPISKTKISIKTEEPSLMDYFLNDVKKDFSEASRPFSNSGLRGKRYEGLIINKTQTGFVGHIQARYLFHRQTPSEAHAYFEYEGGMPEKLKAILTKAKEFTKNPSMKSSIDTVLS